VCSTAGAPAPGAVRHQQRFAAGLATITWFPTLTLDRLVLRELDSGDIDDLYRLYADPHVVQYLNRHPFRSRNEARELLDAIATDHARRSAIHWGLWSPSQQAIIGRCMLYVSTHPGLGVEVGFALMRSAWGQGLMSEAVRGVVDFGFRTLRLQRLHARVHAANRAALDLLARLGFTALDSKHAAVRARAKSTLVMLGASRNGWRARAATGARA
jgi:ribosomal-protein-alanine N-acetyltransferase